MLAAASESNSVATFRSAATMVGVGGADPRVFSSDWRRPHDEADVLGQLLRLGSRETRRRHDQVALHHQVVVVGSGIVGIGVERDQVRRGSMVASASAACRSRLRWAGRTCLLRSG